MSFWELFLIAAGLAMDAFAVSLCKGFEMKKFDFGKAVFLGCLFGLFQAVMPLIGFYLGRHFVHFIGRFDHWVAFLLLLFVGFKMIRESREEKEDDHKGFDLWELLVLAVATSIDALAIGLTFAVLPHVHINFAASVIGVVTAVLCVAAVAIGHKFGTKLGSKAEFLGGCILIFLGCKILFEHTHIHFPLHIF